MLCFDVAAVKMVSLNEDDLGTAHVSFALMAMASPEAGLSYAFAIAFLKRYSLDAAGYYRWRCTGVYVRARDVC